MSQSLNLNHELKTLLVTNANAIGEIQLNRPDQKNAADTRMWRELLLAIALLTADDNVLAIVIHGGESAPFCAGADISEFDDVFASPVSTTDYLDVMETALGALETCPKPTLAAIEGVCIGAGVAIAAACDLRISADTSRFGVTPANLGLVYSYPDVVRLIGLIGEANAKRLLLTGELVECEKAAIMGLVTETAQTGGALLEAKRLAAKMATRSQSTLRASKEIISLIAYNSPEAETTGRQKFLDAVTSDDFREGVSAFREKRKPNFPSRRIKS